MLLSQASNTAFNVHILLYHFRIYCLNYRNGSLCDDNKVASNLLIIIIFVNQVILNSFRHSVLSVWRSCAVHHLSVSQASAQAVGGVLFGLQTLQISLQTFFSLPDALQEFSGFCARLHGLRERGKQHCKKCTEKD